jgi:hypothetical protein
MKLRELRGALRRRLERARKKRAVTGGKNPEDGRVDIGSAGHSLGNPHRY